MFDIIGKLVIAVLAIIVLYVLYSIATKTPGLGCAILFVLSIASAIAVIWRGVVFFEFDMNDVETTPFATLGVAAFFLVIFFVLVIIFFRVHFFIADKVEDLNAHLKGEY